MDKFTLKFMQEIKHARIAKKKKKKKRIAKASY